jgi:hypothetical protein
LVYRAPLSSRPGWSITQWEAINVFVDLQVFADFIKGQRVMIWCDSWVAVVILHSGRGHDPLLHSIACNIDLLQTTLDCDLAFSNILGRLNNFFPAGMPPPTPQRLFYSSQQHPCVVPGTIRGS